MPHRDRDTEQKPEPTRQICTHAPGAQPLSNLNTDSACPFRGALDLRVQTAGSGSQGLPLRAAVTASRALRSWRAEIRDLGSELGQAASWVSHHLVAEQRTDPLIHPHAVADAPLTQRRLDEE